MTTFLALALLLLSTTAGGARRVDGRVQDSTGAAIANADVFVACGPVWRHTTTTAQGEFTFDDLPSARCGVRVEERSFSPKRVPIDLAREDQHVTIVLDLRGLTTEVAVAPSRTGEEMTSRVPSLTTVTTADDILARTRQVLPHALAEEPGVSVQQTTSAQGAPIIRGLIGYQNVAMIDGIRLNTSAWRSGPLQYLAWYSASVVDRIELMRGPGSVLYGSDALGGTVYVRSLQPTFSAAGVTAGASANVLFSSADRGRGTDALVSVNGPRAALIAGGGYRSSGDTRPGGAIDSHAAVTRFLGLPSTVLGSNRMRGTGYEQRFGHVATAFGLGSSTRVDTSYHHEEQTGANRYDRIDGGEGLFRSDFKPQTLKLALLKMERGRTWVLDGVTASFSVNRQDDGRLEQGRPDSNIDSQVNVTTAYGYQLQGTRSLRGHELTAGSEVYDEYISGSRSIATSAGLITPARPDIPDGTRYTTFGMFAQDVYEVRPNRLSVRGGLRYGHFAFSTRADPVLQVIDESVTARALTFQGGAVLGITSRLSLAFSTGRAFRAPNASDLGSIGVTSVFEVAPSRIAALGALTGSNDGATAVSIGREIQSLRPESAHSFEIGARYVAPRMTANVAAHDMELRDTIQRRTAIFTQDITGTSIGGFEIVRQDAAGRAYIATQASPLVTRVNVSRARITGFDAQARVRLTRDWIASAWGSYSHGTDLDIDAPLRRVPPGMGGTALRWQPVAHPVWIEGLATFVLRHARMASGDLSDARMGARRDSRSIADYFNGTATDLGLVRDGVLTVTGETLFDVQQRLLQGAASSVLFAELPGYVVTTLRGAYRVTPQLELMIVGENLTDRNYRSIGSGVDAPGASVRANLRVVF